jgi:hypothetical protein
MKNGAPYFLVEAKMNETDVDAGLKKFQLKLNIPAVQVVNRRGIHRLIRNESQRILVVSAPTWLASLD